MSITRNINKGFQWGKATVKVSLLFAIFHELSYALQTLFGQSFIWQSVVRRTDFDLARYRQKVHVSISELPEKLVTLIVYIADNSQNNLSIGLNINKK